MRDDIRLARRIREGDRRAYEEFVDSYGARVVRLVRRYVSDPADVDDVTQEIFIQLYRSIGGFRGEAALSTWVYRVAVSLCLRYRERMRPDCVSYDEETGLTADDWQSDPAQAAAKHELADRVQSALGLLSPLHRDVVVLHELHGLTYQECATALGLPIGTVKSRLSNAFRRLRTYLGGYVIGHDSALTPNTPGTAGEPTI